MNASPRIEGNISLSLSFSLSVAQKGEKMAENRSSRGESSLIFRARFEESVVCLRRGCRQLVEDVAASYRGPAANGGKEGSLPRLF